MLRLTVRSSTAHQTILQVEGWVSGKEVEVLHQEITRLLADTGLLVLDLDGVRSIDRQGIEMLHRWHGKLELRGGTELVRMTLERHGLR